MKKVRKSILWGISVLLISLLVLLIIQGITSHSEINKISTIDSPQSVAPALPSAPSAPMTLAFAHSIIQEYLDTNLDRLIEAAASRELEQNAQQYSALADKAIELYLNGDWNGLPTEIDGHSVVLSNKGRLYVDGNSSTASVCTGISHSIDLPEAMSDFIGQQFILGDGTYRIERNTLAKYSHGRKIPLSGGKLIWEGMDLENYRPYDTELYYDEVYDKLFLIASSIPYNLSSKELKNGVGIYLYVVPDRNVSEIKLISEITNFDFDEAGLFYSDTSGIIWRYYEKEEQYYVKKSRDSSLVITDTEAVYSLEFSLTCAFADGYIIEKEAFPDGTFTHPVVTTPSVPLSEYSN